MLKVSVLVQILINSFCFDLTSVQLLESHLHFLAQILLRSYSDFAQIFCSNLFALLTFVNLRIFLLKYLAQIFCSDILLRSYSDILLRSCLNLTQILLKSCSDLFALSTFVNLRIFLLRYFTQILLKSYSNLV